MKLIVLALLPITLAVLVPASREWARQVMLRHAGHRPDLAWTGGELARRLLDAAGLKTVNVEATPHSDHYDPLSKSVRMSRVNHDGHTITAYAAAAHEAAHAVQHAAGYAPLKLRTRLARRPQAAGLVAMVAAPLAAALTVPIELDASFSRALPSLKEYLAPGDAKAARQVLRAAAFTYAVAALASPISLARSLKLRRTLRISAKVRGC